MLAMNQTGIRINDNCPTKQLNQDATILATVSFNDAAMNNAELANEIERLIREVPQIAPSISNLQSNPNYGIATDEALNFQASQRWELEAAAIFSKLAEKQVEVFMGLQTQYERLNEESMRFHSRSILIHKVMLLLETAKDLLNSKIAVIESPAAKTMEKSELSPPEKVTIPWLFKHVPIPLMVAAAGLLIAFFVAGIKLSDISLVRESFGLKACEVESTISKKP